MLQLEFLVERSNPIMEVLRDIQVAVVPTFAKKNGKIRPQMHRVWNQIVSSDSSDLSGLARASRKQWSGCPRVCKKGAHSKEPSQKDQEQGLVTAEGREAR